MEYNDEDVKLLVFSIQVSEEDWDIAEEVFGHVESAAVSAVAVGRHPRDGQHPKIAVSGNLKLFLSEEFEF